ncbi:MAG: ABC transporter ATP-binding protein [Dehalococcoidia bacterium]|nr:ABC transporter ATP-binding protein [Dehalococcoidia bacterium]
MTARQGEFLALVGRSGSGKTTLLNMLAGLDRPTQGVVTFEGRDLSKLSERDMVELRRRKIGFVFQSFGLLPLLSAYENVELPLRINGVHGRERKQRVDEVLAHVGLGKRVQHRPFELSGGEQQRVAVARALVTRPLAIFADEPTGELDSLTGQVIANMLRDVAQKQKITVVVATHDLRLAGMVERVLEMEDGKLQRVSRPAPV